MILRVKHLLKMIRECKKMLSADKSPRQEIVGGS